ncbi:ArsR/SmtB family transcription factor [Thermorudis peleae]|uniref:ArsR/SmtB family transcription factor n=1 Tax=Thermorudis peleae TaxID=1382356 RepID=UPI00068FB520|nr:metalloregulator ArsR/SmtB family transcription factor [Thermorudis peleae]MBX6754403.1 winged helix-turn-helix transcriptional regulator [Thermorudis peleae]
MVPDRADVLWLKAKLFRGFADPARLAVLEALRDGPQTVARLRLLTGLTASNLSNHLRCLLDCGLVERQPAGRTAYYRLRDDRVAMVLALAEAVVTETAHGVAMCSNYELGDHHSVSPGCVEVAHGR